MSYLHEQTIDKFFDFSRIQDFIETDFDGVLNGDMSSRLINVYSGESGLYTMQKVPCSAFARKDSFPWITNLGDHTPVITKEYWWVDGPTNPKRNVRLHVESGSLNHDKLLGNYAAIHLQTEGIPRKNTSIYPSLGNMTAKIVIVEH